MAGIVKHSGGSTQPYRVGVVDDSAKATGWLQETFRINPNQLGHLNPADVRDMALRAQNMEKQVELGKVWVKYAKSIMDSTVEIEKFRADVIKHGLAKKEEADAVVKEIILLAHKHGGHIQTMMQELFQGKAVLDAKHRSASELSKNSFEQTLREVLAGHRSKMSVQQSSHQQALSSISKNLKSARQLAGQKQRYSDYINGADHAGQRYSIAGGTSQQIFSGVRPTRRTAFGGLFS
jgi:hypothetical protein